jgi:hypothetical protein
MLQDLITNYQAIDEFEAERLHHNGSQIYILSGNGSLQPMKSTNELRRSNSWILIKRK